MSGVGVPLRVERKTSMPVSNAVKFLLVCCFLAKAQVSFTCN